MPNEDKEYFTEYRQTHKVEIQRNNHNFYLRHRDKILNGNCERNKRMIKERRETVFQLLGNKCTRCGETDWRCLQIDHVNGGGIRESRKHKNRYGYYGMVIEKIKAGSKDYQLLCANCNWKKRYENKECG
jgi:hypothetical protein